MKSIIRHLSVAVGIFMLSPALFASIERWNQLTNGEAAEMLNEVPANIRGDYFLLHIAKGDSEWMDVTDKSIRWMTITAKSTSEHLKNAERKILKIAKGYDKKGNQVVVLLLSDKTTLSINLWNPEASLAYVAGDVEDSSGAITIMHMRCWIKKENGA